MSKYEIINITYAVVCEARDIIPTESSSLKTASRAKDKAEESHLLTRACLMQGPNL